MTKSKKTLVSQSPKDETLEILENGMEADEEIETVEKTDSIQAVKPKKRVSEAQVEKGRQNLEKGRLIKAENDKKRREEAERIALEEKKLKEERLIKKAIAVKKKQIKKQAILDEISDDDDAPIQKEKEIVKPKMVIKEEPVSEATVKKGPIIRFV